MISMALSSGAQDCYCRQQGEANHAIKYLQEDFSLASLTVFAGLFLDPTPLVYMDQCFYRTLYNMII